MTGFDWRGFLARWSAELIGDAAIARQLPCEVVDSGWLGYPGATDEQIA